MGIMMSNMLIAYHYYLRKPEDDRINNEDEKNDNKDDIDKNNNIDKNNINKVIDLDLKNK
jgi:hypothetical protein